MVFVKVQTSDKANGNKGSSIQLVNYLEKEDLMKEKIAFDKNELPEKRMGFFSHEDDNITSANVIDKIDSNKKSLGKNDAKFYSIIISPSEKEQSFLIKQVTGKDDVESLEELSKGQKSLFEEKLKSYSRNVMNEYANNFKRKGLNDGSQLVYFGKVEHYRVFKGTDKGVVSRKYKSGENKKGLNSHIHIIVSRKDNKQKFKLSPLANERAGKSNSKLNGKSVTRGFDRVNFKELSEKVFDKEFKYNRKNFEKVKNMIGKSKDNRNQREKLLDSPQPEHLVKLYDGRSNHPSANNSPEIIRKRSLIKRNEKLIEIVKSELNYKKKFTRDEFPAPDYDSAYEKLIKEEKSRIKNKDFEL